MDSSIHNNSLGVPDAKTRILTDEEVVNVKYAVGVVPVEIAKHGGRRRAQSNITAMPYPVPVAMTVHNHNSPRVRSYTREQIRRIDKGEADAFLQRSAGSGVLNHLMMKCYQPGRVTEFRKQSGYRPKLLWIDYAYRIGQGHMAIATGIKQHDAGLSVGGRNDEGKQAAPDPRHVYSGTYGARTSQTPHLALSSI